MSYTSGSGRMSASSTGSSFEGRISQADADALEGLASMIIDSADGYQEAAEVASDSRFKSEFMEMSRQRRALASEFENRIRSMGHSSDASGSVAASIHRTFLDLRSLFQNDTKAAIAEVERGEDMLKDRFESALSDDAISSGARSFVQQAYQRVKSDHDRWSNLKHAMSR